MMTDDWDETTYCNGCGCPRPATEGFCPECGCGEFSLGPNEQYRARQSHTEGSDTVGRKNLENTEEKRTPVKMRPIVRKHQGKVTEPWKILERLIAEVPEFEHLKAANVKLYWSKDWKADVDGIATGAQVCKASEIDRLLVEEGGGDTPDVFIKLPEKQWPALDDTEKDHRLFHELCHVKPAKDANGDQKRDSKGRWLWRLARHPITAFHEEIKRYGVDRVLGHNAEVVKAIEEAERPLLAAAEKAEAEKTAMVQTSADWRKLPITKTLTLTESIVAKCGAKDILTLGDFQQFQAKHGEFWAKELGLKGNQKEAVTAAFDRFWAEHPEFCGEAEADAGYGAIEHWEGLPG